MTVWQTAAALIAGLLALLAVAGFARYPRPISALLIGLLIGIPTLGFADYAWSPGPVSEPGLLTWLAFVPVTAGVVAGVGANTWLLASRGTPLDHKRLRIVSAAWVVMWAGIVLGISDVLALWEPGFAIANLAVNAVWLLVWLPRRTRELNVSSSLEVEASPARVFAFMEDVSNWRLYLEDVEEIKTDPDGPLQVGTVLTVRRHVPVPGARGPRMMPNSVETKSVVIRLEPDRLVASANVDRPTDGGSVELTPVDGGARITTRAHAIVPLSYAILGSILFGRAMRRARQVAEDRSIARLKELLDQI